MKKLILLATLIGIAGSVLAQQVNVSRESLGSGQPGASGVENATKWDNDIYHAPQYMPGYPTAAVLYPRIVDVQCTKSSTGLNCKGYNWTPDMGRAEYLMIRTTVVPEVKPVAPIVVTNTVTIIKEVPVKQELPLATKKIGE
jgi:hypothetical protein